jgi:hypothetical protein
MFEYNLIWNKRKILEIFHKIIVSSLKTCFHQMLRPCIHHKFYKSCDYVFINDINYIHFRYSCVYTFSTLTIEYGQIYMAIWRWPFGRTEQMDIKKLIFNIKKVLNIYYWVMFIKTLFILKVVGINNIN